MAKQNLLTYLSIVPETLFIVNFSSSLLFVFFTKYFVTLFVDIDAPPLTPSIHALNARSVKSIAKSTENSSDSFILDFSFLMILYQQKNYLQKFNKFVENEFHH